MSWHKLKSVILIILVVTNAFLLVNLIAYEKNAFRLPEESVSGALDLLDKNGITARKGVIPTSYEKRPDMSFSYYTIDELSEMLLGGRADYTSDGKSITAEKDGKSLSITGNSFSFETGLEKASRGGRRAISRLKKLGFFTDGAYFDKASSVIKLKAAQCEIDGLYLDAYFTPDGALSALSGSWGRVEAKSGVERTAFIFTLPKLLSTLPEGSVITDVQKLYILRRSGQNYSLDAAWRVKAGENDYSVTV